MLVNAGKVRDLMEPAPSRLRPPRLAVGVVRRERLVQAIDRAARVALIVAPPGHGKTVLAQDWAASSVTPVGWMAAERLHDNPIRFWSHFLHAVRSAWPALGDEPDRLLLEDHQSAAWSDALLSQLDACPFACSVVVDDLAANAAPAILDGLDTIVNHAGEQLRIVITARADPPLPWSKWRSAGWSMDVRAGDLRLLDAEAIEMARVIDGLDLDDETVVAINRHVDRWPIAVRLVLSTARDQGLSDRELIERAASRQLHDFLVDDIVDRLPGQQRDVLLDLAVCRRFDAEIAHWLAGPQASDVIADLARRQLLIEPCPDESSWFQMHRLLQELLESEARWRNPTRHVERHRLAAQIWHERGDLNLAYQHLSAIGDTRAANDLLVTPLLDRLDHGDIDGVRRLVMDLPSTLTIDSSLLANDVALGCFLAQDRARARHWAAVGERRSRLDRPDELTVAHATLAVLDVYDGDLDAAAVHLDAVKRVEPQGGHVTPASRRHPVLERLPLTELRLALARGELGVADTWLARFAATDLPPVHRHTTLPAFTAWLELQRGHLALASELADAACTWAEEHGLLDHHGTLEAMVTSAWCRIHAGAYVLAADRAGTARDIARRQSYDWNRLRAGEVAAHTVYRRDGSAAATQVVRDVQRRLDCPSSNYAMLFATLDRAFRDNVVPAGEVVTGSASGAAEILGRARRLLDDHRDRDAVELVGNMSSWPYPYRLVAELLAACAGRESQRLAAVVGGAGAEGWVTPLLGHGPRVDEALLALPLEQVHPTLIDHLRQPSAASPMRGTVYIEPLNNRERTILALLPSHLTYNEIADRLLISVNTVKSGIKAIYRKLGVSTRSDAVDTARSAGLI